MDWVEEEISSGHARDQFDCGVPELNDYLATHARRQHDAKVSRTFVMVAQPGSADVLGYYTLALVKVPPDRVPYQIARRLGGYDLPFILLGRLAVRQDLRGGGVDGPGAQLFIRAAYRAYLASTEVGGIGLVIDAKFDAVLPFYRRYGAVALEDEPRKLFIPWGTLLKVFPSEDTADAPDASPSERDPMI